MLESFAWKMLSEFSLFQKRKKKERKTEKKKKKKKIYNNSETKCQDDTCGKIPFFGNTVRHHQHFLQKFKHRADVAKHFTF